MKINLSPFPHAVYSELGSGTGKKRKKGGGFIYISLRLNKSVSSGIRCRHKIRIEWDGSIA